MLHQALQDTIAKVEQLVLLTQEDIQDLTEAKNDEIFKRLPLKENLIKAFEESKARVDQEMVSLRDRNPQTPLANLLDQEALDLIGVMKEKLKTLKEINSGYAKSVYALNEFYTSLLRRIVPHENVGYGGHAKPQQSFLTIQA